MNLFIRLSTQCLTDEKILAAGSDACWLWVRGLLYSKVHLTDGMVPKAAIPLLSVGIKNPKTAIKMLVTLDLWQETSHGYTVGLERWSRWQVTSDNVETQRDKWRDRKRKQRDKSGTVPGESRHQSTEYRVQSTEGDPPLPPLALSHDVTEDPEENIPDGLHQTRYANFVLTQAGIPGGHGTVLKFADAIGILAKEEACTMAEATKRMLDRVRQAKRAGPVKWGFWLEERRFANDLEGVSTQGWEA